MAGLLPIFSCAGLRYSKLYSDTGRAAAWTGRARPRHGLAGAQWHAMIRPARGHNTTGWATIRRKGPTTQPTARGHAAWLVECVTIQSLYRDMREAWPGVCHDTIVCIVIGGRPGRWGVCHDTIGCIVIGGGLVARLCCETGHDMAVQALRQGRAGA